MGPDSNSFEQIRDDSHQSSKGHSSCSSPLKVGNINIYNMPKTLGEQQHNLHPWLWKYQNSEQKHKVSHQSSIGKMIQGSSPDLIPTMMQLGAEHQSSEGGLLYPGSGHVPVPPFSGSSHQGGGGPGNPMQQASSELLIQQQNQAPNSTTMMSRNHSVANILEQVIKRLEGLKSRE